MRRVLIPVLAHPSLTVVPDLRPRAVEGFLGCPFDGMTAAHAPQFHVTECDTTRSRSMTATHEKHGSTTPEGGTHD